MEKGHINDDDIVDADEYVVKKIGYILHNDEDFYSGLKRIRNKRISERLGLKNTPYFREVNKKLISQYRMSSGECLLISLLHFIYNSIIRRSLPSSEIILMLIDEIELALHPVAIMNLIDYLFELTKEYDNLTVYITSHSPEVIRKIPPADLFKIEYSNSEDNSINVVNPCYPSYAIRDVYTHDGFDYLLLVEDKLAKLFVQNAIKESNLSNSRLINITPVGGYLNVLDLQYELEQKNILGVGKKVFSILDRDIMDSIKGKYKRLKKIFLPIPSIEKFLYNKIIVEKNVNIIKELNDTFFIVKSIGEIISQYKQKYKEDNDGKKLYHMILNEISKNSYSEDDLINTIYKIGSRHIDFSKFNSQLAKELQ